MQPLKTTSILLLLFGLALLGIGIALYWVISPIPSWASVLVLIGILLLLGAIVILCIDIHYELEASIERIKLEAQIRS